MTVILGLIENAGVAGRKVQGGGLQLAWDSSRMKE